MRARRVLLARDMGSMRLIERGGRKISYAREEGKSRVERQQQIQKKQVKARMKW
jgi:hypothetical protein